MITSSLDYLHEYKSLSKNMATAIDYVLNTDFSTKGKGRYEVDGDNVFAIVNEYMTKVTADCRAENHRKYTDIQIIVSGIEKMGVIPFKGQEVTIPFKPDNDVAFYKIAEQDMNYTILRQGDFIIFFPSDIHQPDMCVEEPTQVKKVVMKVAL